MWIVRLALRRPYTFVVAALVLLLLTPFVLQRTPTDIFPEINIPVISVVWVYNGLNAKEVEERIVYNHERMISTLVNDIEHIESTAYNGAGVIKVFLQPGASVTEGVAQITATGQTVLRLLPPGINPPFIISYNASSVPILQYSLASPKFSEQELQDMAMNRVKVGLATVRGASVPYPAGGKARVVAVDIDLAALESKNLAPQDVVNAINAQNFMLPSGTAKIGETEYSIALNTNPEVLAALNDLPIKTVGNAVIRIGDVAQLHDGYQPQQNVVRLNGVRGVLLTILKSGAASTLSVVDGVKKTMPRILSGLPPELEAKEFADQSLFVRAAVNDVVKEGVIAAALTAMMILLFLGSWRSTFIIALSIPLSVLASLALLSALGETINLMTLGGLALAVGILVDDATVTIENIHVQMAMGKPNIQAILDGAQEIAMPAFVSTLCICIVFVPMFFLTGVARHLFVPLAEAVVFAMLASYALSRTLVPTLVMWFYHNIEGGHPADTSKSSFWLRPFARLQRVFEHGFDRFREGYRSLLGAVLSHRNLFSVLFLSFCAGTGALIPQLGQNFFPTVKLSGIAGFQSGGLDMLFDWPSRFWAVGPSVTLPLFQGGQLNATLRQTKAVYEETVAKYRQTVLSAFAEVENNLSAEYLLTDEYSKVLDALKSGRRQQEIAGNRYSAGLATYLEVATAQNVALGIERTSVRLRGQQLVSVAALVKALGGGWQAPESYTNGS